MPLGNDLNSLTPPCDDYFNWSSEMYSDTLQNQNHKISNSILVEQKEIRKSSLDTKRHPK